MLSNIIVIFIVIMAILYIARRLHKSITQKTVGCHCDLKGVCDKCMETGKWKD